MMRAREPWLGACFERHLALAVAPELGGMGWYLAHGMIWRTLPQGRIRFCAAWMQSTDDGAVLDITRGYLGTVTRFYREHEVDMSHIRLYVPQQVKTLALLHHHAGPWDKRLFDLALASQKPGNC